MKRSWMIGFGALATLIAAPVLSDTPVMAQLQKAGLVLSKVEVEAIVQNVQRQPQVELQLSAQQKVVTTDEQGKSQVTWQEISGQQAPVQPGDELRYTLKGENTSDRFVNNLVVTQPIPQQMVYVLDSATVGANTGAEIVYSIDGGKNFVQNPKVKVTLSDGTVEAQPAPADAYTHIRWNFGAAVAPNVALDAAYQVKVR